MQRDFKWQDLGSSRSPKSTDSLQKTAMAYLDSRVTDLRFVTRSHVQLLLGNVGDLENTGLTTGIFP